MLPSPHGTNATDAPLASVDNANCPQVLVLNNGTAFEEPGNVYLPLDALGQEIAPTVTDALLPQPPPQEAVTTSIYVPNAALLSTAETQLLEHIELQPAPVEHEHDNHEHEDINIDLGAPPMLPVYHESPEEAALHPLSKETSRRLMWTFLFGFAFFTCKLLTLTLLP